MVLTYFHDLLIQDNLLYFAGSSEASVSANSPLSQSNSDTSTSTHLKLTPEKNTHFGTRKRKCDRPVKLAVVDEIAVSNLIQCTFHCDIYLNIFLVFL